MRILVTGAAGMIGSAVVESLCEAGHEVVATDLNYRRGLPVRLELVDLRECNAIYPLLEGCEGLVHLGNHPNAYVTRPMQRVLAENVAMNTHVFAAAIELGVSRVVFASSVQAISGMDMSQSWRDPRPCRFAYLPVDGEMEANPGNNPYGMSKMFGEIALANHARHVETLASCSIRLPMVMSHASRHLHQLKKKQQVLDSKSATEAMSYLQLSDAAGLFRAAVERCPLGHRVYMGAQTLLPEGVSPREFAAKYLPEIPVKGTLEGMEGLVDMRAIERDLGWKPVAEQLHYPSVG